MSRRVGVIMNGVTGRMGTNQHLIRSILAIRRQGGVQTASGETVIPEPVLTGRNEEKLRALAEEHGVESYTTDLDACLADPAYEIYFDAQTTNLRAAAVRKAIAAGKSLYCEKPTATTTAEALALYHEAAEAGVKNGVVQDKLWLPGLVKLKRLVDSGFFGTICSVRGEFGYWVFDGTDNACQRPSWNYRAEQGGSIIVDMFCHWRYVLDNLFGNVRSVCAVGATHIPQRIDEKGNEYACTADDAAYSMFELDNNILCQFNSSWAVRVRRDDLLTLQVDGTEGSAVAGLHRCFVQKAADTPVLKWNPDVENPVDYGSHWREYESDMHLDNAFKLQWELFLKHVAADEPFHWTLLEGARGVQLAEKGIESWKKRCWVELETLD